MTGRLFDLGAVLAIIGGVSAGWLILFSVCYAMVCEPNYPLAFGVGLAESGAVLMLFDVVHDLSKQQESARRGRSR